MSADRDLSDTLGRASATVIDRRELLTAGGLVGLSTLGIPTGTEGAFAATSSDPVSMAMHIHGSFSEGTGSMDAHLDQARRLGVDVIWWTDHDFRLSAFGYRESVRFDGAHEAADGWDFSWTPRSEGSISSADHTFVSSPTNPDEAGKKLHVQAISGDSATWASYLVEAKSQNTMYSTSYCDTKLVIDVRPQNVGSNARGVVEVVSSYRPATSGRPAGQYRIQYRIGDSTGYSTDDGGLLGIVGIQAQAADQWQRLTLDLRADHARLWPDTIAEDAALWRLRVGVQTRNGANAQVLFDRLRFVRQRSNPADGMALLQSVIEKYEGRYPNIRQYAASEISLVLHLNAFGGDLVLPTYTSTTAKKDSRLTAQRSMVNFLHNHGATVSLNHPLQGTSGPSNLAARLVNTRGNGADVIEIGVGKPTQTLLHVFDIAARNGVFLTANGSTDDHRGTDWLKKRRWLTRVWSPTKQRGDLCAALKAGRAWFYDPARWDGALDLRVEGLRSMGGVLFTKKAKVDVTVRATALPYGSLVYLVIGRCDFAGAGHLSSINKVRRVAARNFKRGRWSTTVERGVGIYVRATIRDRDGNLVAVSNPLWVLPVYRRDQVAVPHARS